MVLILCMVKHWIASDICHQLTNLMLNLMIYNCQHTNLITTKWLLIYEEIFDQQKSSIKVNRHWYSLANHKLKTNPSYKCKAVMKIHLATLLLN